jgi:hypothetical protein
MKRICLIGLITMAIGLIAGSSVRAQDSSDKPITVSFSDPSRPGTVHVSLMQGGISVKAYNGKDVIIQTKSRPSSSRSRERVPAESQGLHRLDAVSNGLRVEEENNVMSIGASMTSFMDVELQVPAKTNLKLSTLNGGDLVIEGVDGDIEVNNNNGKVTLTDVAGSVVAHSLNGKVLATLKRVTAGKPMSFTSLNGDVDVTLPPDVKANVKLRTDNGDVYTDFDVQIKAGSAPVIEDTRKSGGRYKIERDRSVLGAINGGGPDFELRTMNGNVYIRKAK